MASAWMTSTLVALGALLAAALLGSLGLHLARRLHWFSATAALRLRRAARIAFGVLLVASFTLPYLLAHAPWVGVGFAVALGLLVAGGFVRDSTPTPGSDDADATIPPRG